MIFKVGDRVENIGGGDNHGLKGTIIIAGKKWCEVKPDHLPPNYYLSQRQMATANLKKIGGKS